MPTPYDFPPELAQQKRKSYRQILGIQRRSPLARKDAIETLLKTDKSLESILAEIQGWEPPAKPRRGLLPKTGRWYRRRGMRSLIMNTRCRRLPILPKSLPKSLPDAQESVLNPACSLHDPRLALREHERVRRVEEAAAKGLPLCEADRLPLFQA